MAVVYVLGLASFLHGSQVFAQTQSFAHDLQGKLDQYYEANIPLVLDMQFNQPAYVPGDTAWFSMWLTTEREGLPVAGRQIIQVNLNRAKGDAVWRQRVLMNDGVAHGQIVVPDALEPGIYTVVAWTNWMSNDSPEMYCYRQLVVAGERTFTRGPMAFRVYPEAGVLVDDVPNAVTITGRPGVAASLYVNQQLMQNITLDHLGYGQVLYTPSQADIIAVTHGSERLELPHEKGVAMNLLFNDSVPTVTLTLRSSRPINGSYLALVSRGRVLYTAMISFQEGRQAVTIPRRILGEGIVVATLFDDQKEVLGERMFIANISPSPIRLTCRDGTAHPRDSMDVVVQAPGLGTTPLTVSIYAEDLFQNEAELRETNMSVMRLPLGALQFNIDPTWTLHKWNTFLMTQQWKRFRWNDVLKGGKERKHAFEKYLNFKGKVVVPSGTSVFDSVRVTFFLRNEASVYEQYVDETGAFDLDLFFDFDNEEEVIYTIDRKGTIWQEATIVLAPDETPSPQLPSPVQTNTSHPYASFASLRQSITAAYQNFERTAPADVISDPNASVEDELFEADVIVTLDDYLLFPTMEETLREIVPRLQHRWKDKQHTVRVALSEPDMVAHEDPLYFIDGILTDDTNYFMSLRPTEVLSIKIVSSRRKLQSMGILGRNGVVLVTTKARDLKVPRTRKSFVATGITRPIRFNDTFAASTRIPILRSTAFINSLLAIDPDGKGEISFALPDNTGSFIVEVTGLSETGTIYRAVTRLRSLRPTSAP